MTYTIPMSAPVDVVMTARITVDAAALDLNDPKSTSAGRTLGFFIYEVKYTNNDRLTNPVKNIEIPEQFLVSVNSAQAGAEVTGAKMGNNTITTNDATYEAARNKTTNWEGTFFAAFVSNSKLSASVTSNSSLDGGTAGGSTAPVVTKFVSDGTNVTIGLSSIRWPYDYLLADSNPSGEDHTKNLTAEQKVVNEDLRETPFAKVVITPEQNGDEKVNWQDGAIAFRETVMHIPANSELVRDQVSTRIALNFGSTAQNPFLASLDNAKRVAAHTDGLGQAILQKGYANEGHDSAHPDYYDIGTRMGGAEDFQTMLTEGKKIGAYFGIHVNASEMYAESKAMSENLIRYNGLEDKTVNWGWSWHDNGIKLRAVYDFGTGDRAARFQKLANEGGGELSFVYLDVWGNGSGGTEDSWQTRMVSNEITQMENKGWRITQEWSYANPYDSTWQHWSTDYTYGGYGDKGQYNSAVLRFLLNQYKDSFPADFPNYGGACNAPLLGGPAMQGFEGWQGDGEYDLHIYNTYNQLIATKFLQHFGVTSWTNAKNKVTIPYSTGANGGRGSTAEWQPEMQIKLSGKIRETDEKAAEIVVTRGLDAQLDENASFSLENEVEYRSRVITLNGKTILKGAPASAGEDNSFPQNKATLEYLIPWYWGVDGTVVSENDEKLYYWNGNADATSSSEWELPDGWENLANVVLYELSDQGRDAGTTVAVTGGKVTFASIKPNTGYVVVKGEKGAAAPEIVYYAAGQHLTDPSFNDASLSAWDVSGGGKAAKYDSLKGISVLKLTGEVAVSQELVELKPNTKYAAYVAVENKCDSKAFIKITDATGKELGYNYTERSIARNYISGDSLNNSHGIESGGSLLQQMYVFFTAPASGKVNLTLGRTGGSGNVYFDAVRVVETQMEGWTYDAEGNITGLNQSFEHSVQGEWPFVVGPVEGVSDQRQHLSERNEPYTQSGWNVREVDDVLDGNWSLKTHGLTGNGSLVYQTIPQNFRFEPGKAYTVSFDYQMGSEDLMQVVIGDGAWSGVGNCQTIPLEMAKGTGFKGYPESNIAAGTGTKTCTFTVVGSESGQTWFGIATADGGYNSTGMFDTSNYAVLFSGRADFILDNLKISLSSLDLRDLSTLVTKAKKMSEVSYTKADNYSGTFEEAWAAFVAARTAADNMLKDPTSQSAINSAKTALENAMKNLKKVDVVITGTVTNASGAAVAGATVTLENSDYRPVGLTATTDAKGKFTFQDSEDVVLNVATYKVKVEATGYYVKTADVSEMTKDAPTATATCQMEAEAPGAYVNDFNNGDVSMMQPLVEEDDTTPLCEPVNYNGSGALKVTFRANSGETRHINNVVDKTVKIKDGVVSFDVTGLSNTSRLGVTLRGLDGTTRIFVGQEDSAKRWFWEWWGSGKSSYDPPTNKNIGIHPNETRNVRVELDDNNVKVYIDGIQIYDATMTGAPTEAGYVGLNMRNNAGTSYIMDNLRIVSTDAVAEDKYTVEGTVKVGATPLAGAAVSILDSEKKVVTSTTTNAEGKYKTQPLDAGTYTVQATAPNYTTVTKEVTITDANLTAQDFTLSVDKSKLQEVYSTSKDIKVSGENRNDYTDESFAALTKALKDAEAVLANDNATAEEIGRVRMALEDAVKALKEKETDFSLLRGVYERCKILKAEDYTVESFANLTAKLNAAGELLFGEHALQKDVDAAAQALLAAEKALVPIPASNLEELKAAIAEAETVTNDGYTDDSWNAFQAKLAEAKAIAENATAYTQTQVDNAVAALKEAQAALTKKPNKPTTPTTPTTPSQPSQPSEPTNPGTTTETVEHEDGSTTTTVTDTETGKVTETTVQPDGAKVEKVTTPEEGVTVKATDASGAVVAEVVIPEVIPEPETKFDDVAEGHWAEQAINNMAALGLVNGVDDGEYAPNAPMTRGALATILHRLSNTPEGAEAGFGDVEAGKYYADAVAWAAKVGVVNGVSDTEFAPNDEITREQLAVMLVRFANLLGMDTSTDGADLTKFADANSAHGWATDGLAWCVKNGIMQGMSDDILSPTTTVTRAQVATMLDRLIGLIK